MALRRASGPGARCAVQCESRFPFEIQGDFHISMWRPHPTFYPSPKMAMQAPAEKLAFVAMLNANDNRKPDALAVVDVEPESSGYGHIVGQVDMPHPGDELQDRKSVV